MNIADREEDINKPRKDMMETIRPESFPASSRTASTTIDGHTITATSLVFADKLLFTLTASSSNLAHWLHVPLAASSGDPLMRNTLSSDDNALLPRTELTATTTLGGTKPDDEVKGQTLAVMVAGLF